MPTMVTFLFVAVLFGADGRVEYAESVPARDMETCERLETSWLDGVSIDNAEAPPSLAESWHAECRMVTNDSSSKGPY